jgi:peptide/nickel transport system ATP-binding protein
MPELRFDDVSITYRSVADRGDVAAVRNVSLTLPRGGTLGIAGESGSGKSTLAMAVLRLLPRSARVAGRVLLDDRDVMGLSFGQLRAVRWSEAAIVFQGAMHSLNPVQRVGAQIVEALELHVKDHYRTEQARWSRMVDLLAQVDVPAAKAESFPHEMSGGQRQRVMIAMALACDPDLVIADEPTTALDVVVQAQVLDVLGEQVRKRGISLLFISHDLSVLASTCERIAVMRDGVVVEEGPSQQIVGAPSHPYTAALAAAFPTIGDPASRMRPASRDVEVLPPAGQTLPAEPVEGPVLLEARDLTVAFHTKGGSLKAVDRVSLACRAGEIVALVGQSGSGKSTLLNILGILDDYDAGEYWLGDTLIRSLSERRAADYRNRFIGFVFQSFNLIGFKNAVENGALPLYYQKVPRRRRNRIALEYLERVGLRDWAEHLPSEMSGGQKQRVAIARALIGKPKLILADEPTGALDSETSYQLMELLREINHSGITILVVTHEHDIAERTDRTIRLRDGVVVEA